MSPVWGQVFEFGRLAGDSRESGGYLSRGRGQRVQQPWGTHGLGRVLLLLDKKTS